MWCGDIQDLETVCHNLSIVYEHFTQGRVSKPMTLPKVVIAIADDLLTKRIEEAIAEELGEPPATAPVREAGKSKT